MMFVSMILLCLARLSYTLLARDTLQAPHTDHEGRISFQSWRGHIGQRSSCAARDAGCESSDTKFHALANMYLSHIGRTHYEGVLVQCIHIKTQLEGSMSCSTWCISNELVDCLADQLIP